MTTRHSAIAMLTAIIAVFTFADSSFGQGIPNTQNRTVQVKVDTSNVKPGYTNFSRVTGTPEELIIDFALNPNPTGVPPNPLVIDNRVVMNYYTAKRLLRALQISIQRHEQTFGPVETDIKKRMQKQPGRTGTTAAVPTPSDGTLTVRNSAE